MSESDVKQLALMLMAKYGLTPEKGWSFGFNNNVTRMGVCRHPTYQHGGRIELSLHYATHNPKNCVVDTILHEIAHALVGPGHGHGPKWKEMARRVGAKAKATERRDAVNMPKGKWSGKCGNCKKVFYRHRVSKVSRTYYCTKCGPELGTIDWRKRNAI